jgi:thiamine transport system permease protein
MARPYGSRRTMNARASPWNIALAAPLTLFVAALLVYPLSSLLLTSNANVLAVWRDPYFQGRLAWTLFQAGLSTLLVLALGTSSAVLFARYGFRGRALLESLLGVPFVVPMIVAGIGFLALFGARGAILNLSETPYLLLLANVFYNYGVVTRALTVALEGVDRDLELASQLEGATPWQVLRFVTLPHARPTLRSSALLTFLYCFASFGVPLLLAPAGYATLEVEIYQAVQGDRLNEAAALVWGQLVVTITATALYARAQQQAPSLARTINNRLEPRGWARVWLTLHIVFALALTLGPLAAVVWRSVWNDGFTLEHYAAIFAPQGSVYSSDALSASLNNLRFVALALFVAVPLGIAHALAVWHTRSAWLEGLALLPLTVSATLVGIAYIAAFGMLTANVWLLVGAYALVAYPFVVRGTLEGLRALDEAVLEAARVDGASALQSARFVVAPLIAAPLRVGVAFAAAVVIGEFGATLVLQRPEWTTLTTLILDTLSRPGGLGPASAGACVLLALTAIVFAALNPRSRD